MNIMESSEQDMNFGLSILPSLTMYMLPHGHLHCLLTHSQLQHTKQPLTEATEEDFSAKDAEREKAAFLAQANQVSLPDLSTVISTSQEEVNMAGGDYRASDENVQMNATKTNKLKEAAAKKRSHDDSMEGDEQAEKEERKLNDAKNFKKRKTCTSATETAKNKVSIRMSIIKIFMYRYSNRVLIAHSRADGHSLDWQTRASAKPQASHTRSYSLIQGSVHRGMAGQHKN